MTIRLAFILLLCLCAQLSHARGRHYNVVNYTTDNGLPQNSITGIQFDRKGYCWLGTQMGLVRFDGQQFSIFGSDNIKGLRSDRILDVTRDVAGAVFASTGGITDVLRINDNDPVAASVPLLLPKNSFKVPSKGFMVSLEHAEAESDQSPIKTFGTSGGNMYQLQPGLGYYTSPSGKISFPFTETFFPHEILLIGEHMLLLRPHTQVQAWTKGVIQPGLKLCGPLWRDPDFIKGDFAAPGNAIGAYVFARNTLYKLSLAHDTLYSELIFEGIEIPAVSCLYADKQNDRFYIGSGVSGLFIITPTDFYSPAIPNAGTSADFYSQAVTEEGIISGQFLFRRDGSHKELPLIRNPKATWYRSETRSLYYVPDHVLRRFEPATGKTFPVTAFQSDLSSVYPDPAQPDILLFSTSFSIGKIRQDTLLEEKTIQSLQKGQELFASYPIGTDTFLLATWSGVKWYDYRHNRIYRSVLDSLIVRQLYPESRDRVWIATYGKGWYLWDKGRIVRMPDGPQEALKTVNAIIDDRRGHFWLSSNDGLYKVSRQALLNYAAHRSEAVYFYTFTTKDHLPTNEFNASNPSYVWLPDSMLSLPSIKGLVWFYPHQVHLSLPDKGIYIEHIRINQAAVPHTSGRLDLDPDHGRLSLKVSSPYFGNKENMQLQYRIEGLEDNWQDVPGNGELIIDRIPAGTYALVIRKFTGMEPGQYTQVMLPVRVHPYWYQTRWFYLLLLLLSATLVLWLIGLRTRILKARNRKLQTLVALQTRDLNRFVRQLVKSEDALKESNQAKDNIITTVLHDLRSPIRFMYTISRHIAAGHHKMPQETLDTHLQELKNSTASLNSFTEQFFTWAMSQHRSFEAKYSMEALADIFGETEALYTDIMSANGNQLIVTPTELYCYTDPQLLSAIIRNLLDNANKNTHNGVILLAAVRSEDKVIISVSDTGKGFTPEALKAFLNRDKSGNGSGRGSFIILYLLGLIGGDIEAESTPDLGTIFRISLSRPHSDHDNKPGG